jgi:hypothetical protein
MKSSKAPPVPDASAIAAQQGQMNKDTAIATQNMNFVNQQTPDGSLTYSTNGYNADGTPQRTATVALNPGQQQLYNQQMEFGQLSNQLGIDQTKKLSSILNTPLNLNNKATEGRLIQLGQHRLDPMLQRRQDQLETSLTNQGITRGSEAWREGMNEMGRDRTDAWNQLLLTGRGQAIQEALLERNQPINEITALMNGGQVSMPQFQNTPQTQVANTDLGQMAYNSANLQNDRYKQDVSQRNAMLTGMFGLGSAALGGWGSFNGFNGAFGAKTPKPAGG